MNELVVGLSCQERVPLALVIDDCLFSQKFLIDILSRMNFSVITASNGLEGLKIYNDHKPDMVFIDLDMPVFNGFKTCSVIRQMKLNTLIFMVTASHDKANIEEAFALGADDYFLKPIMEPLFSARIRKFLKDRKAKMDEAFIVYDIEKQLKDAKKLQESVLPKPIKNQYITVTHMFCPHGVISGDGLDYFWREEEKRLFGYLFDVTGHSISSAMQVFSIRMLLEQHHKYCSGVDELLYYTNAEMFKNNQRPLMVTAIAFNLDVRKKKLDYAAAGISPFYVDGKPVKTVGYPLGYKKTASYETLTLDVKGSTEIIFATDGYSELLSNAISTTQDDIAAISIKLRANNRGEKND